VQISPGIAPSKKTICFACRDIPTFRKQISVVKKFQLGEFEEIVILTIAILHTNAYGVSIKKEIESRLSRKVSMGALHTALVRLENKGYVRSTDGEATQERAGRPKKYFQITALGQKAMAYTKETRDHLWKLIPKAVFDIKGTEK
jgi:PadR family transcriptional regulator PadR